MSSASSSTLTTRTSARSGRTRSGMPAITSATPLIPAEATPEQKLWFRVLLALHEDLAYAGGNYKRSRPDFLRLSQQDKMQLDFVAVACGLPYDTLPRLEEAARRAKGESQRAAREEARQHLAQRQLTSQLHLVKGAV